jgi:hypothetical protein
MDLREISYEQAVFDLHMANYRILELSVRLAQATGELKRLQKELRDARHQGGGAATSPGEPALPITGRKREVPPPPAASFWGSLVSTYKKTAASQARKALAFFGRKPKLLFVIDEVCGRQPSGVNYKVSRNEISILSFRGWAVPMASPQAFEWIEVTVLSEGSQISRKIKPQERPDVGLHFGNPRLASSGFLVQFPLVELNRGSYTLVIVGILADGAAARTQAGRLEII